MKAPARTSPFRDVRKHTFRSRVEIGFSGPSVWQEAEAFFDDHTLTIEGHPVMEDWEDSYMYELASIASTHKGVVLEVGYGMGISTRYIQTHAPTTHIVIEANRHVFKKLLDFAAEATAPVQPLFGFWQELTPKMIASESLSGILFDTYPLNEEEIHSNHFSFFKEAYRMLKPGGVLTYYSDEISDFSPSHLSALQTGGFKNIDKKICRVTPPKDCRYWKSKTIVAPIVVK